jgi:hypothetical protein
MSLELVLGIALQARQRTRRFHVVKLLLLIACVSFGNLSAIALEEAAPAYKIKSAFLYNFAKFIQWPPKRFDAPDAPLIIGVIGGNPFGDYLTELQRQTIGAHRIQVEIYSSAREARHCHVLFIKEPRARATKIIEELRSEDVLTVTDEVDEDSFKSEGAVINLVTTANKTVHFEINVDAARRAELNINSSLLNLAKIVRDGKV